MAFLNRPSPEDADLAEFADSLRATLVAAPPAGQVAAIVPRLAEEARIARAERPSTARPAESHSGSRLKTIGQLALGFCLVPLVAAGLATAGVKLPEPAQSAFESVGIDLPNQKADPEPAPDPPTAPVPPSGETPAAPAAKSGGAGSKPGKGRGKAKGQAKAKGQQPPAQAPGQSGTAGSNGNGNGNSNGSSASPGNSGNAPGHNKTGGSASPGVGNGNGQAVGQTEAVPPGQANKPESPGNSADAPGKTK